MRRSRPASAWLPLVLGCSLFGVLGCSRSPSASPPVPNNSAPVGTLALGERITSPLVPLADIAKDPSHYQDRVIATSGKVTAVCREMGCWMELEDATGRAHIKMHGHAFFVPKTAPGHLARVQATLVKKQAGPADDCEEGQASAKVELDATGVEID
jgi:Domain of unknown function (DUF4920)